MINYISQYYKSMNKKKVKDNKIDAIYKWKVNYSVPLLNLQQANYHCPLLPMSLKTIKHAESEKTITQFHVVYMSMSLSK